MSRMYVNGVGGPFLREGDKVHIEHQGDSYYRITGTVASISETGNFRLHFEIDDSNRDINFGSATHGDLAVVKNKARGARRRRKDGT